MGFFKNIIDKFKKATRKRFIINKNNNSIQILLNTKHQQYFTLNFDHMDINTPSHSNTFEAYSINATNKDLGSLYLEAIKIDPLKSWNVSPNSAFYSFITKELSSHKFEYITNFDDNFCSLQKYKVDDSFEIGIIWFSLNSYELFIVDQNGKLFNDLLNIYNVEDNRLFIKQKEHEKIVIKGSLTQNNFIEDYF